MVLLARGLAPVCRGPVNHCNISIGIYDLIVTVSQWECCVHERTDISAGVKRLLGMTSWFKQIYDSVQIRNYVGKKKPRPTEIRDARYIPDMRGR